MAAGRARRSLPTSQQEPGAPPVPRVGQEEHTRTNDGSGAPRSYDYPLTPVIEIPSMKVRWARKKRMSTGATTIVLTAIRYG